VLACLGGIIYPGHKLLYWYVGLRKAFSCENILIVSGLAQGGSNALCFLHLYLRANAINRRNPAWLIWRVVGALLILGNWASLLSVAFQRKASVFEAPDGPRCVFMFEPLALRMKYILQLLNHVAQSSFFIWPLFTHIAVVRKQR
jgi:hypothetical protein